MLTVFGNDVVPLLSKLSPISSPGTAEEESVNVRFPIRSPGSWVLVNAGGEFQAIVYNTHVDQSEHLALIKGDISPNTETLVRVHTKDVPGDVFGFELLNTGAVIQSAMEIINKEGKGVILYLQPELHGLRPAMVAYPRVEGKQQKSMNPSFFYRADFKEYGIGA